MGEPYCAITTEAVFIRRADALSLGLQACLLSSLGLEEASLLPRPCKKLISFRNILTWLIHRKCYHYLKKHRMMFMQTLWNFLIHVDCFFFT